MTKKNISKPNELIADEALLLRIPQVCSMLGQGRTKVFALINAKELKVVKIGRSTRVTRKSVKRLAKRGTRGKR